MKGHYAANEYWEEYRMRMDDTFNNAVVDLWRALKELVKAWKTKSKYF